MDKPEREKGVLMKTYRNSYEILDKVLYRAEVFEVLAMVLFVPIGVICAVLSCYFEIPILWVSIVGSWIVLFVGLVCFSGFVKWRRDILHRKMDAEQ